MQAGLRALGRALTARSCFEKTEGRLDSLKVSVSGNTATSEPINPDETGRQHFASRHELEAVLIVEGLEARADALEGAGADFTYIPPAYRQFAVDQPRL
jgi:hypothetical protein